MNNYEYSSVFFDFIDKSSGRSASSFIKQLNLGFKAESILDIGCGRGVWLKAWKDAGIPTVLGVDGDYVDRHALQIDQNELLTRDISKSFDLGRRFDLVECLEVAEHILEQDSATLVRNITSHGDVILFSAATPGQGGEHHINEQPICYWATKFSALGYSAYDYPRTVVNNNTEIEPWYRYNTILYANMEGEKRLSDEVKKHHVPNGMEFKDYRSSAWKIRCLMIRILPQKLVNLLAIIKHRIVSIILP